MVNSFFNNLFNTFFFKKIFFIVIFLQAINVFSQVGIDKVTITNSSCILEFGSGSGIKLPLISNTSDVINPSVGTLIFDTTLGSFRYYEGLTPAWSEVVSGGVVGTPAIGADLTNQGVIIGDDHSSANGVLILGKDSGETKALVLPIIKNPSATFTNPPRGLMVFDISTNQIAVFNGNNWTYF